MFVRVNWVDHVTERPRTYMAVTNSDGSITFTPAMGEVIQQGTPQSATNFNKHDEAIQHSSVSYDELYCLMQAELRAAKAEIETLKSQVAALASAG